MFQGGLEKISDDMLQVDAVIHEAWVKVDEAGTEAAAATGVSVGFTSEPMMFQVNRAFLFTIQDDLTDSLLFMGRVSNPLEE